MIDYIWWLSLIMFTSGVVVALLDMLGRPGQVGHISIRLILWVSLVSLIGASLV